MENKKLNVTYECHTCGHQVVEKVENHADVSEKIFDHGVCTGSFHPVHVSVVED